MVFYLSDTRAGAYKHIMMPLFHAFMDAEESHKWSILFASKGLVPRERKDPDEGLGLLETEVSSSFASSLTLLAWPRSRQKLRRSNDVVVCVLFLCVLFM
jgi:hypothetical protein